MTAKTTTPVATKVPKRRVVKQQRSKDSQVKLLAAANELFAEKGYQRTKITDIIQRSGCSIGSFYHQFTDKHGIFEVLFQQYLDAANSNIDNMHFDPSTTPQLGDVLQIVSQQALHFLKQHLGARMAAEELVYQGESTLKDQAYHLTDRYIANMNKLIPLYQLQIGSPHPEQAMASALQMMATMITSQTMRPTPHLPQGDDALVAVLVQGACGILEVRP